MPKRGVAKWLRWFSTAGSNVRTAVGTAMTYVALVVLLWIAGSRVLVKSYPLDLIVTVALGSTLASGVLDR